MSEPPVEVWQALRKCYEGRCTQAEIATAIGVTQGQVSAWMTGRERPTIDRILQVEEACGRPRGFVVVNSGLVDDHPTVEQAIDMDGLLTDDDRDMLKAAYEALVTRRRGEAPEPE